MSQVYSGWRWKILKDQLDGSGVYGYVVVVLFGNVMMVYGGWDIGIGEVQKRQDGGLGVRFLNLIFMEWGLLYKNLLVSLFLGSGDDGDMNFGNLDNDEFDNSGFDDDR